MPSPGTLTSLYSGYPAGSIPDTALLEVEGDFGDGIETRVATLALLRTTILNSVPANVLSGRIPLGSVPPLDLKTHAAESIDSRLDVLDPAFHGPIFQSQVHTGTPAYVRSTHRLAPDIDLSCVSVWNSQYGDQAFVVAIDSPGRDIVIMANHMTINDGATVRFVTNGNVIVNTTVIGRGTVGVTDIQVARISPPLPTAIGLAKLLPADYASYDLTGAPVLKVSSDNKLLLSDITFMSDDITFGTPSDAERLEFHEDWVGGDGGAPAFIIVDAKPVLLGTSETSTTVPALAGHLAAIDALISGLGSAPGLASVLLPTRQPQAQISDAVDVAEDDIDVTLDFPTPFAVAPRIVVGNLVGPTGAVLITSMPLNVTASGFTVVFGSAIPGPDFKYCYVATA